MTSGSHSDSTDVVIVCSLATIEACFIIDYCFCELRGLFPAKKKKKFCIFVVGKNLSQGLSQDSPLGTPVSATLTSNLKIPILTVKNAPVLLQRS